MGKEEIIFGINPIYELLRSGRRGCREVLIAEGRKERGIDRIIEESERENIPIKFVQRNEIDRRVKHPKHQGVIAIVESYPYSTVAEILERAAADSRKGFILILDGITDPQNMGAIIRTANLLGVHGILIPKDNSAPINATVVKSSAGATEYTLVSQVTNIIRELDNLRDGGYWIYGADGDGERSIYQHDFTGDNVVLIIGAEGKGMRRLVREHCDQLLFIPMEGEIESYNASVAGAIFMSEVARQKRGFLHANSIPKQP